MSNFICLDICAILGATYSPILEMTQEGAWGLMRQCITALLIILFVVPPAFAESVLQLASPPSLWVQQKGDTVSGPAIEILQKAIKAEGIVLKPEILPWVRAISHLKSGLIDVIPVIFRTEEREEYMVFSSPYLQVPTVIAVAAGKTFPFENLSDLKSRRGSMMKGDSISDEFAQYQSNLTLTEVSRYKHALKMLVSGRVDYVVAPKYGCLVEIEKLGYEGKIEFLPLPVASRGLRFAFSRKSERLSVLPKLNEIIEKMQRDGSLERMIEDAINNAAGRM